MEELQETPSQGVEKSMTRTMPSAVSESVFQNSVPVGGGGTAARTSPAGAMSPAAVFLLSPSHSR